MSRRFDIEDHFPAPPEVVVELVLNPEVQQRMYRELGYQSWSETRQESDAHLERVLTIRPPVVVPAFVRKAFGDNAGYREYQTWASDRRSYTWKVVFDLTHRLEFSGTCVFEPDGTGCVRRIQGDARARVPLIGGRLEAYVVGEAEASEHASARWMADDLRR